MNIFPTEGVPTKPEASKVTPYCSQIDDRNLALIDRAHDSEKLRMLDLVSKRPTESQALQTFTRLI